MSRELATTSESDLLDSPHPYTHAYRAEEEITSGMSIDACIKFVKPENLLREMTRRKENVLTTFHRATKHNTEPIRIAQVYLQIVRPCLSVRAGMCACLRVRP